MMKNRFDCAIAVVTKSFIHNASRALDRNEWPHLAMKT
jgi:hypothetical protein